MSNIPFFNYRLSNGGLKDDIDTAMKMVASGQKGKFVSTINPHSAVEATKDAEFESALQSADLLIPDGIGVVWGARLLGQPIQERVTGFDFFWAFSERAQAVGGVSYFFLGSSPAVLRAMSERLKKDFPNIRIAGSCSPPFSPSFSDAENAEMCAMVNASGANVLWVGMTAPKQEKWIYNNRGSLNVAFSGAIGAVFDFYAGTKQRAPQWIQNWGGEWLHRLYSEPKRVWRRYLINNPVFLLMLLKAKMKC